MGSKQRLFFEDFSTSFPSRPTTTTSRMALSSSRGMMRGLIARGRQFCTSRSSKAVVSAEARKANFDRSAVHPVYFHLKGGSKDTILFKITQLLALVCMTNTVSTIYTM